MEHFSALCNGVWHYETTKELGIDALNVCEVNSYNPQKTIAIKIHFKAKNITLKLTDCDADILAACSYAKDEYEATIEVQKQYFPNYQLYCHN